jgi:adenylosuccinate lyase
MIERYTLPRMGRIWSEENKFEKWLRIEILVCEAYSQLGMVPPDALERIRSKAKVDIKRIKEIEATVKHDLISFLTSIEELIGEDSRYIHMGLTSADVVDTALSCQMVEAAELIIEGLSSLKDILAEKALLYKDTVMIGRTHGVHAEPITFGLKLALWYEETKRNIRRMEDAKDCISYGKISGAVGNYAHVDPFVERYVCEKLGLKPAPISSQIIPRDSHAQFMTTLAIVASSLEKFATEVRNLARTDIWEVEEPFGKGQKGSSAMPHKRNPEISERICGLARIVRANALASLEAISLWHERDLSNSSTERVVIPDSCILVDYMINMFKNVIAGLVVYPDRMRRNMDRTRGAIYSQRLLLALLDKGVGRGKAYEMVQRNALRAHDEEVDMLGLVLSDPDIRSYLSEEEIRGCFDPGYYTRRVDEIFERVGLLGKGGDRG